MAEVHFQFMYRGEQLQLLLERLQKALTLMVAENNGGEQYEFGYNGEGFGGKFFSVKVSENGLRCLANIAEWVEAMSMPGFAYLSTSAPLQVLSYMFNVPFDHLRWGGLQALASSIAYRLGEEFSYLVRYDPRGERTYLSLMVGSKTAIYLGTSGLFRSIDDMGGKLVS